MNTTAVITAPTRAGTDPIAKGLAMAAVAMFCYALMDACSKSLLGTFDPMQLLAARCILALGLGIAIAWQRPGGITVALASRQKGLHLLRGMCAVGSMTFGMLALATMPLAEVLTIIYSAPIAATLLAIPILGDQVGVRRLTASAVGFCGVVLVAGPGGVGEFNIGIVYAIASMFLYALCTVLTRRIGREDSGLTIHIYTQFCFMAVAFPLLPFVWVTPDFGEASLILCAAVAGTLGIYLLTMAHQSTPPAIVAPVDYTIILWGTLLGALVWGEMPTLTSWIGIAIITGTGLYIAQRELVVSPLNRTGPFYLWARRFRA